jgi:hypothetical protein
MASLTEFFWAASRRYCSLTFCTVPSPRPGTPLDPDQKIQVAKKGPVDDEISSDSDSDDGEFDDQNDARRGVPILGVSDV